MKKIILSLLIFYFLICGFTESTLPTFDFHDSMNLELKISRDSKKVVINENKINVFDKSHDYTINLNSTKIIEDKENHLLPSWKLIFNDTLINRIYDKYHTKELLLKIRFLKGKMSFASNNISTIDELGNYLDVDFGIKIDLYTSDGKKIENEFEGLRLQYKTRDQYPIVNVYELDKKAQFQKNWQLENTALISNNLEDYSVKTSIKYSYNEDGTTIRKFTYDTIYYKYRNILVYVNDNNWRILAKRIKYDSTNMNVLRFKINGRKEDSHVGIILKNQEFECYKELKSKSKIYEVKLPTQNIGINTTPKIEIVSIRKESGEYLCSRYYTREMTNIENGFLSITIDAQIGDSSIGKTAGLELSVSKDSTHFIKAVIYNHSTDSVKIVLPGDGSYSGRRTPIIRWSIIKKNDETKHPKSLPDIDKNIGFCGNMNPLKREELVTIKSKSGILLNGWTPFPNIPKESGEYSAKMYYFNHPNLSHGFFRESVECFLVSNELIYKVE